MSRIEGLSSTKKYINKQGQKLGRDFQKQMIDRSRALSIQMQKDLVDSVDKGAVAFTKRAILFTYKKKGNDSFECQIIVKDAQAKYLREIITDVNQMFEKFIPTSAARLTREGNIAGLRNNIRRGRYQVVKSGRKERLIDTQQNTKKKRAKRVIGVREEKRRKMIYDFYAKGEAGFQMVISGVKGSFRIGRT